MTVMNEEVEQLTEEDVSTAVMSILGATDSTIEELRDQAAAGRFTTERARRAWFSISALVED